jgi:hypothetical protein
VGGEAQTTSSGHQEQVFPQQWCLLRHWPLSRYQLLIPEQLKSHLCWIPTTSPVAPIVLILSLGLGLIRYNKTHRYENDSPYRIIFT